MNRPVINYAGPGAYYYCHHCGIELHAEEVGVVAAGPTYGSGTYAYCPECGEENLIDRDDER